MARTIGTVQLDDMVNSYVERMVCGYPRVVQLEQIHNRMGRLTRIKEDAGPLRIDVRGWWRDGGGKFWRDFEAALLSQSRVPFTLGDGTRYEYVDVTSLVPVHVASRNAFGSTPDQAFAYTMMVDSYEPVAREVSPTLQSLGALTTGSGSVTTNFTVNCVGTAFSEPTWQFTLVIPGGVTVSQVGLTNSTSGEACSAVFQNGPGGYFGAGTWTVLMDASGGSIIQTGSLASPANGQYGLLTVASTGFGVTTWASGFSVGDADFAGRPPTLVPSLSPSIPPTANPNSLTAQITATGTLTSANLSVVAPARYYR